MSKSRFGLAVANNRVSGSISTTPELTVTCSPAKFRANGALTRKLGVKAGDRLMFITNEDAMLEMAADSNNEEITMENVQEHIIYGVAKGVAKKDKDGIVKMVSKRLTDAEAKAVEAGEYEGSTDANGVPTEVDFTGSKLASTSGSTAIGAILEASDAVRWNSLGGSKEVNAIWGLDEEPETLEVEGVDVECYILVKSREEAKAVRAAKGAKANGEEEEVIAPEGDEETEMA